MKKLHIVLAAIALLALSITRAKGDTHDFSYTGTDISASGTFTTSDTLTNGIGGFSGLNGYAITGITGVRNGLAINGLVPGGPGGTLVGQFMIDNALMSDPLWGLTWNGVAFSIGGDVYNIASNGYPMGGGYTEYVGKLADMSYTGTSNAVNLTISHGVPDSGSTAFMLAIGGIVAFSAKGAKNRRNLISPAPTAC